MIVVILNKTKIEISDQKINVLLNSPEQLNKYVQQLEIFYYSLSNALAYINILQRQSKLLANIINKLKEKPRSEAQEQEQDELFLKSELIVKNTKELLELIAKEKINYEKKEKKGKPIKELVDQTLQKGGEVIDQFFQDLRSPFTEPKVILPVDVLAPSAPSASSAPSAPSAPSTPSAPSVPNPTGGAKKKTKKKHSKNPPKRLSKNKLNKRRR